MPYSTPLSYEHEEQESATLKWIILFIVLSLVVHALLLVTIIILSKHIPAPKLESTASTPTVALSLIPPPPVPAAPPKKIFMMTPAQKNAKHKETLVESANDDELASQSKKSRKDDTIMPDVVSKDNHPASLDSSPNAPQTQKPEGPTTPPTPKQQQAKPQPPTPQQPQQPPQPKAQPSKTPPQPTKTPPPPTPAPTPSKTPPPPAVDANGLPVLPMLNAPTMAPQTTANAQAQQQTAPPPSIPAVPANMAGMAGISGQPTPESMKTELGAYKAQFYAAVGSQWYSRLSPDKIQLIGVGSVRVHYTIYADGTIKTWVIQSEASNSSMSILLPLSENSIRAVSPFKPFSPAMQKEVGDSYSDDFTFSIY